MNPLLWCEAYRAVGRWEAFLDTRTLKALQTEEIAATLHLSERPGTRAKMREALHVVETLPPLSIPFLCTLHRLVKVDGPRQDAGHIRTRQNWIGPEGRPQEEAYFFPPKPSDVKPALHVLLKYLRQEGDPLLQLAIGMAQFLIIHPFMDGNGRVARLLIPYYLMRRNLPPLYLSAYFKSTRLQYLKKLYDISAEGNMDGWIAYFLKGIRWTADAATKKSASQKRKARKI